MVRPWQASWMATSELEHAVSMVSAGPCRSRKYAMRADSTDAALPHIACAGGFTPHRWW
jgi:hypothetical protein